ncbi:MAG: tRNA threonylcarbamoyladenosine dehydratase [Magnetococcus sp. WYHC-3]
MTPGFLQRMERTRILVGDDGLQRLASAHVLVCGLGGVGSYAAEGLCRAGVGRLTLVDADGVSPSNINRQLHATVASVGQSKVALMGAHLERINPDAQLDLQELFLDPRTTPELLDRISPHWVADCIDSLNCKVNLLVSAQARGLAVISSMGAGGRFDPTAVRVDDLMDTHGCPLAREVRNRGRRQGLQRGVLAVWSDEPPRPHRPPEPVSWGRPRAVNGTLGYLPALFGMTLAGTIVRRLLEGGQRRSDSTDRIEMPQLVEISSSPPSL